MQMKEWPPGHPPCTHMLHLHSSTMPGHSTSQHSAPTQTPASSQPPTSTLLHVDAALRPLLSTWMILASSGLLAQKRSFRLAMARWCAYVEARPGMRRRWCVRYSMMSLSPNWGRMAL